MPTHNAEKTINDAIESILEQTYTNIELIVVDDASTDSTKILVEKWARKDARVKLIFVEDDPERFDTKLNRNINAGYSARNKGMAFARGEYITFQDADDASFLNRIEVQYKLLIELNAAHITTSVTPFKPELLHTVGPEKPTGEIMTPTDIIKLARRARGIVPTLFPKINQKIPFHTKRKTVINKLFFSLLDPYPGAANSPLFKRTVYEKVKFRKLSERIWPSFMGRGADRDFNFQVATTFKNSYFIPIPLYMWRK
jgi:glycosyltransferase involved in cell wall biosynthesis